MLIDQMQQEQARKEKDFEDYLGEVFMKEEGYMFLDDDLPDQFDRWLCDLQADDFIKYGNEALKRK